MHDLRDGGTDRIFRTRHVHFHDIKTDRPMPYFPGDRSDEGECGSFHGKTLSLIDGAIPADKTAGSTCFNLDENKDPVVQTHEIEFLTAIEWITPISGNDTHTAIPFEILRRSTLSQNATLITGAPLFSQHVHVRSHPGNLYRINLLFSFYILHLFPKNYFLLL